MRNIVLAALRWVLVLPASFFASGAAAWLFGVVTGLQYAINVVAAPNSIEQNFYAVAADFIYGWVFVSAGAATAPGRRPIVAVTLICVLVASMVYTMSHGTLRDGISVIWAALRTMGYIGGATLAVWIIVLEGRTAKAPAASL